MNGVSTSRENRDESCRSAPSDDLGMSDRCHGARCNGRRARRDRTTVHSACPGRCLAAGVEGMAGRANAHQRLARLDVLANDRHLLRPWERGGGRSGPAGRRRRAPRPRGNRAATSGRRSRTCSARPAARAPWRRRPASVISVLYSSSPIRKTARGRSSGWNRNAGWPVRSVDVIVGATYFSMCSTIRLVPSKWLT